MHTSLHLKHIQNMMTVVLIIAVCSRLADSSQQLDISTANPCFYPEIAPEVYLNYVNIHLSMSQSV